MLIDTHTHLYLPQFDEDREHAVARAQDEGVGMMFLPNIDSSTVRPMLDLCEKFPAVIYPMMALHPGSVNQEYKKEIEMVRSELEKGKYIAVGETGIDLYHDKTYLKEQIESFEYHVALSLDKNLPLVIHARESFSEIFNVLNHFKQYTLKGVFHSFTGGMEELEKILDLGFHIGINGIITFRKSGLVGILEHIPSDRLLLETDSPYLSPVPKRGQRNESAHLRYINDFIAHFTGVSPDELAGITARNALKLFKLPGYVS